MTWAATDIGVECLRVWLTVVHLVVVAGLDTVSELAARAVVRCFFRVFAATAENQVSRLQLRIAKAIKIGRYAKAKALQWLLTHSFFAKLLAIKRVTQNTGKRTPGVDGVIWKTDKQKMNAAYELKRKD